MLKLVLYAHLKFYTGSTINIERIASLAVCFAIWKWHACPQTEYLYV